MDTVLINLDSTLKAINATNHKIYGSVDSISRLFRELHPLIEKSLTKTWHEVALSYFGPILIPVLIFILGYYFQKLRDHNKMIEHLQSYKLYAFNCVELLYLSCLAQSNFIKEYLEQFEKYDLEKKLTATSTHSSLIVDRIDFSELYSGCVEFAYGKKKSKIFKRLQDTLSVGANLLQEVLPAHKDFTKNYSEMQRKVMQGMDKISEVGSAIRGITDRHQFFFDVCTAIVNNNYTAPQADSDSNKHYYLEVDKIEQMCKDVLAACNKFTSDPSIHDPRVQIEVVCQNMDGSIRNYKGLFDQYKKVFENMSNRFIEVAAEIKKCSEELAATQLENRRAFGFIGRRTLPPIELDFT
jgi:hypothetical protein